MHICPIFCNLPKESAAEACMLPHEYLLAEINSFMQHSEKWNTATVSAAVLMELVFFCLFVLFMLYTFGKSSQKLPCYIFMQQKSPQAYRISVTEPHPCNNEQIAWFSEYQISSSLSLIKLPYFSSLPLSVCFFVLIVSHASLFPMTGIICTVFLMPSRTIAFLFLQMFSLQKGKKHSTGHSAGLADKRWTNIIDQCAMENREHGAAPSWCCCRHSETPPVERDSCHCERESVQSFRLGFGNIWSHQFLTLLVVKTFAFLGAWHL